MSQVPSTLRCLNTLLVQGLPKGRRFGPRWWEYQVQQVLSSSVSQFAQDGADKAMLKRSNFGNSEIKKIGASHHFNRTNLGIRTGRLRRLWRGFVQGGPLQIDPSWDFRSADVWYIQCIQSLAQQVQEEINFADIWNSARVATQVDVFFDWANAIADKLFLNSDWCNLVVLPSLALKIEELQECKAQNKQKTNLVQITVQTIAAIARNAFLWTDSRA